MKTAYPKMSAAERKEEYQTLQKAYAEIQSRNLNLNMARGKPGKAQLDLVSDIFLLMQNEKDWVSHGLDVRNYGEMAGLESARKLFAEILDCRPEQVFVGGNASLQLMYDTIAKGFTHGLMHSPRPWCQEPTRKWLCPAPGYDRHFAITESFGFEMIVIPMTSAGPDMNLVEKLIQDPAVKGMWNVPKYSNPDGVIYSPETIERLAAMKPAAPDFVMMWDNAYCIHEFDGEYVPFPDIFKICKKYDNEDMVFEFASTSKITLPGAGMSCFACSEANMAYMSKLLSVQVISFDKVNQQRHVLYLQNKAHTLELMQKHAQILGPKFKAVLDTLEKEIAPLEIANWQRPKGGYFVSLNVMPGTAKRVWTLCKKAGVVMTDAGATFPYGKDPQDTNLRIAPSLPPVAELEQALEVLCLCVRMAALEKLGV